MEGTTVNNNSQPCVYSDPNKEERPESFIYRLQYQASLDGNKPLTWDELQEMQGQTLWVETRDFREYLYLHYISHDKATFITKFDAKITIDISELMQKHCLVFRDNRWK